MPIKVVAVCGFTLIERMVQGTAFGADRMFCLLRMLHVGSFKSVKLLSM